MANCSPKKDQIVKTLTGTYPPCPTPAEGETATPKIETFGPYTDKYWFEVRPPLARKTITNGSKKEKLVKTVIQIPALDAENADGDIVNFIDQEFYQQEYVFENNKSKPVYERVCKADKVYDEQYFYHIFEWPLEHDIQERTVGGIIETTPPTSTDPEAPAPCPEYAASSTSVSGTFTLARVDSEVIGLPEGSIAYHGGTLDNKIFFYYKKQTDLNNIVSVNTNMIAVGDVINGWTVDKVVNYNSEHFDQKSLRTTESVRRRVSKVSEKNKTPGFIFINKNDGAEDRKINVGDLVTGYGIQKETYVDSVQGLKIFLTKPLKYKNKRRVRNVKFTNTGLANNISNQILCYAEISGGSAPFVKDQYYSKDTPSTPQSTSIVYHVFDNKKNKDIQLTTTKDIRVQAKNKNDEGGSDDSENRKYYLVTFLDQTTISNKNDVQITITDDQSASGSDTSFRFVSKVEVVNNKSFKVWFKTDDNKVNTFVRGWNVTRVPGGANVPTNTIQVIAGKGIVDRSAVCGVYVSNDKKFYTYTPLFYSRDGFCESTYLEDDDGKFILGSVILDDGSYYLQQQFLCVAPAGDAAYQVNNVFWTYFNRPAEKNELATWVSRLAESNFLTVQQEIVDTEKVKLGTRTVLAIKDSECDNNITPDYSKVYYPHSEFNTFNEYIAPITNDTIFDPCLDTKTPKSYSKEELDNVIKSNLQGNFNLASINLPEEMYKQVISNENSLQNTLLKAIETIGGSVPKKTTIPNLPPQIEGEDKSSQVFKTEAAYRIPPRFKSLEYVIEDFSFVDDSALFPDSDENNIKIQIKSIPRWTGSISPSSGAGWQANVNTVGGFINTITISAVPFVVPIGGGTIKWAKGVLAPGGEEKEIPLPEVLWHGEGTNYQVTFEKTLNFRVNEVSKNLSNAVKNKGNPYMDEPPYAKLTQELKPSDTTITVDSTHQFISAGYLIIPKFIVKKEINPETRNETLYHYYLGEEIIYYRDKTETQFLQCTRGMFSTTASFEKTANSGDIESGVTYIIKSLGSINWKDYGAPDGYTVGTVFTATSDGSGTAESGEVYLFESTMTPFTGSNYAINSYQKNNYLSQFWPISIQDK
jgi:hypothetical protein